MDMPANLKTVRRAFTLVEMLVVIVIIGILVGLTAAALGPVRIAVRNAVINAEIEQLGTALQNYKNEHDEFPPTFIDVNIVAELGADPTYIARQRDARNAIIRHLKRAFPRYMPGRIRSGWTSPNPDGLPSIAGGDGDTFDEFANDVYYEYSGVIYPLLFDPASALVFWLGGLPESYAAGGQWIPAGFHSDPEMPFKSGTPRKEPLFDFEAERVVISETHYRIPWDDTSAPTLRYLRYLPAKVEAPYVYFRARRRGANWQYGAESDPSGTPVPYAYFHAVVDGNLDNICVAYRDPQNPPYWRNYDAYQIIAAGLDGQFGTGPHRIPPDDPAGLARNRVTKTAVNFSDFDYDNLTNFCDGATLEDEIQ